MLRVVSFNICRHLIRNPGSDWSNVDHFPVAASELLDSKFSYLTSTLQQCQTSSNKETTKLLIRLQDGMQVEAVIMQYDTTGDHLNAFTNREESPQIQCNQEPSSGLEGELDVAECFWPPYLLRVGW